MKEKTSSSKSRGAPPPPGVKEKSASSKQSGSSSGTAGGTGTGAQDASGSVRGTGPRIVPESEADVAQPPFMAAADEAEVVPQGMEENQAMAPGVAASGAGDGQGPQYSPYETDSRVTNLQWQVRCIQLVLLGLIGFVIFTFVLCYLNVFGCRNPPSFPNIYMINETTNCISDGCKDFVSRFSDTVLPMVDPCEDFYEHVCGGWLLRTHVPLDSFAVNVFSEAQAALTEDVMEMRNTKGVKPLLDVLTSHGIPRWPMLQGRVTEDVMITLGNFIREVGLNAIVSVRVGVDQADNQKHILYIGQPEFGVERSVLRGRHKSPYFRILHRYKVYMYRSALILGATVAAADLVNEIAAFEGRLAAVKWTLFLNNILKDTPMTLDLNDKVVVADQGYLRRMSMVLKDEPP
ncbi:hypothetical protein V5799_032457 [Amblyomma americanum]|uniref:Peptidase M13 N-terminal domain-containing protein n=1 Tax=Amblyomma americanum TaxID=6943 RepID=A0AAQ4DR44_AMBAM